MADDQGVKEPEGQSQEVATPATEQKVSTEPKVEGQSPIQEESDELGLPKDASDRTRSRVQELLDENKRLKEASLPIPEPVQQPIQPIISRPVQGVPPKTDEFGNVNPAYVDFIEQRQEATEQAVINSLTRAEAKEAENAHPEIKSDKELLNMASAVKMYSLVYPDQYGGKELSLKEALDFVKTKSEKTTKTVVEEVNPEKEQASLGVEGRPTQGVQRELSNEDQQSLVWETRRGNADAMITRMKNIPSINSKG